MKNHHLNVALRRPLMWLNRETERLVRPETSIGVRLWVSMVIGLAILSTIVAFMILPLLPSTLTLTTEVLLVQANTTVPFFAFGLGVITWISWAIFYWWTGSKISVLWGFRLRDATEWFLFAITWSSLLRGSWMIFVQYY